MNLKRLIIFFLTTVPLVANGTNVLLPESTRVGVSVSYEGDRHINRVARDYSNIFFSGFALFQRVEEQDSSATWTITLANDSKADIEIGSLWLSVSPPKVENKTHVSQTLMTHYSVSGNSSYIYWLPLNGKDDGVLMLPQGKTGFEFLSAPDYANESTERRFYIHGKWDASPDDTWHIPLSSVKLAPGERVEYSFLFVKTMSKYDVATQIAGLGGLTARIAPGLVTPVGKEVLCAFESRDSINGFDFEYPHRSNFTWKGKTTGGRELVSFKFRKQGENRVVVNYGDGKKAYLEFFVTEPFANLILKRAKHISEYQQHRDTSKWYDGLYSVWNMENGKLLSPEYRERFPEFTVGGSDDPSNCKPLFISEKNVFYPNKEEIKALEYYEDNFVFGKLQRTGDETPYPYGIYGSENWYQNRSGEYGDFESGGWGLQRLWRTFDYTTHIAIYYNLYLIASNDPSLTVHPASYWLDLAYNTTKAFFTVPYDIFMKGFAFTGWCDWAFKQGNFHERYILELIDALELEGEQEKADHIRTQWEKKVLYFMYDDPWPYGSEYDIDRTAFESTYYIADYGCRNYIEPRANFWQDKNSNKWYSYESYDFDVANNLMDNQIECNLAMREINGLDYWTLGTSWSASKLEYMCMMGGAAILDYAVRYSDTPYQFINYGYNSIISSWSLVNTGAWSKGKKNIGAAGWKFFDVQNAWVQEFEVISNKRGPVRYDGEIDHGFAGGVHGLGTYVVNDPDFSLYAYGGSVKEDDDNLFVKPDDGVCRRLFTTYPYKYGIELRQDAFSPKDWVVFAKDSKSVEFHVVNRYKAQHKCHLSLWNLDEGRYDLFVDGTLIETRIVKDKMEDVNFCFNLNRKALIKIVKQ